MKKSIKTFKEVEITKIDIKWSIHACSKMTKKGLTCGVETKYMTVKKIGRRKEKLMHDTLAQAMVEVGL